MKAIKAKKRIKVEPPKPGIWTTKQLVMAYRRGFSNGIGIGEYGDVRFHADADKMESDAFDIIMNPKNR